LWQDAIEMTMTQQRRPKRLPSKSLGRPIEPGGATHALAIGIEYWRTRRNITRSELAKRADIDASTVVKLLRGDRPNVRLETVEALAKALEVSVPALYSQVDDDILMLIRENRDYFRDLLKKQPKRR
jgi:DNA-binding Xre family transcriptional regulator